MSPRWEPLTPEERFWARVDKTDTCWNWTGAPNDWGYGTFVVEGRKVKAHRFAFELENGPIPEGMQVDHRCRKPACVNPNHLRLATNKQNAENVGPSAVSASGIRGVHFEKRRNKWCVQVTHQGKNHYGGGYTTAEEAEQAAKALRLRLFTHSEADKDTARFHSTCV